MIKINQEKLVQIRITIKTSSNLKNLILLSLKSGDLKTLEVLDHSFQLFEIISSQDIFNITMGLVQDDQNFKAVKYLIENINAELKDKTSVDGITLLAEACVHGSIKIAELLLKKNYRSDIKDVDGMTALHKAVTANNIKAVNLLIKHDANVNAQETQRLTPLHIAVLRKHKEIVKLLEKNNKVHKNLKEKNGYTYKQLSKLKVEVAPVVLKKIEKDSYNLGISNYLKAIFTTENNDNYFIEAISQFKKSLLNDESNKESILKFLVDIFTVCEYEGSANLEKYIIKEAAKYNFSYLIAEIYNIKCARYLIFDDLKALEYGELALKAIENSDPINGQLKGYILFNLGLATKNVNQIKSLKYFCQAEEFLINDHAVLQEQYQLHISLDHLKESLNIAEKISFLGNFNKSLLYKIYADMKLTNENVEDILQKYNFKELKNIYANSSNLDDVEFKNNYILFLDIQIEIKSRAYEYEEAIKLHKLILEKDSSQLILRAAKILEISRVENQIEKGLEFIQEIYQKFPKIMQNHNNVILKFNEFIIYELKGLYLEATNILEKLNNYIHEDNIVKHTINLIRTFVEIERKDFDKANKYFEIAFPEKNKESEKLKQLIDYLQESFQEEQIADLSKDNLLPRNLSLSKEESAIVNKSDINNYTSFIEWTEDINELPNDPKIIHGYFQQKKQALAKQKLNDSNLSTSFSWATDKGYYSTLDKQIVQIQGKDNYYATIKLKLDPDNKELYEAALNKGEVTKQHHSKGIKFIPHKLITLKAATDLRLCTNEIFKNPQGKYLIIFDQQGNHPKIKKIVGNCALKITEVKEYSIEKIHTHLYINQNVEKDFYNESILDSDYNKDSKIYLSGSYNEQDSD